MSTTCGYYKVPKKKKYCVLVYKDQVFQSKEDLQSYLCNTEKFSAAVAEQIISNVSLQVKSNSEIRDQLTALKIPKTKITKYLAGTKIR